MQAARNQIARAEMAAKKSQESAAAEEIELMKN